MRVFEGSSGSGEEGEENMMHNHSSDTEVTTLSIELAKVAKRKEVLRKELESCDHREKELALKLNSALGLVPLQEAADRVSRVIQKCKEQVAKMQSNRMRERWLAMTPEKRTEYKAKMKAARWKKPATALLVCFWLLISQVCFAQRIPCPTLQASWYSVASLQKEGTWKHSKGVMANGELFNESNFTCATRLYPLRTLLLVTNIQNGRTCVVRVTDRIGKRFATKRIDLSKAAFAKIASLQQGLVSVKVEVVR
jgi:rare lipoprotein A (peptidoglycan hydrolase)